jgi:hypothetical protein
MRERKPDMSGFQNLTVHNISRNPLPAKAGVDQVANWILSVVPCGTADYTQTASDTDAVIGHLKHKVGDEVIAAALHKTGYRWTLSMNHLHVSTAMRIREVQEQTARNANSQRQTSMGSAVRIDPTYARTKAAQLETLYVANAHNPEYQEKLRQELEALLIALDDPSPDPMPGRGQMADRREQLRRVQQEILLNSARNVGAHIRHLGPLALDRLRRHERPDPRGVPYRAPNLRTPRR